MAESAIVNHFLEKHNMLYTNDKLSDCVRRVTISMLDGLKGRPTSLLMLPTYVTSDGTIRENEKIIVIDAGGTNLRVALVRFNSDRDAIIEKLEKFLMPGIEHEVTVGQLFDAIAQCVYPLIHESSRIAFCFSYACNMMPNGDGRLVSFCKEIKVTGDINIEVCATLEQSLVSLGAQGSRKYTLINDSVAVLLGAKAGAGRNAYSDYIGFVLGTGTNMCYNELCTNIEKEQPITKMPGKMVINMETGMFSDVDRGTVDYQLDEESAMQDDSISEKMIGGKYLPEIVKRTLVLACEENLFSNEVSGKKLADMDVTMADIDMLYTAQWYETRLAKCLSDRKGDLIILRELVDAIIVRASILVAANIIAVLQHTQAGMDSRNPVCISMEGTTITKSQILKTKIQNYVQNYFADGDKRYFDFIHVENATLIGTAAAGLLN